MDKENGGDQSKKKAKGDLAASSASTEKKTAQPAPSPSPLPSPSSRASPAASPRGSPSPMNHDASDAGNDVSAGTAEAKGSKRKPVADPVRSKKSVKT